MRKVVVDRSLTRWQRVLLVLGVLVAAWGPAHSGEVAPTDHSIDSLAHSHRVANAMPDGLATLIAGLEPGGHDDSRCGHRDAERDATQASPVRLPQPDGMGAPRVAACDGELRSVGADLDGSRAPPGQRLLIVVCVWRQ